MIWCDVEFLCETWPLVMIAGAVGGVMGALVTWIFLPKE
jgi:hypothetical protein